MSLLPPTTTDRTVRWLTVDQVASIWNRTPRMIRRWCVDGTLVSMGAKVYRDRDRWFIGIDPAELADSSVPTIQ